jgi:hypothetical protein
MSNPRTDPGATIAARGQRRADATPTPLPGRASTTPLDRVRASLPQPLRRVPVTALFAWVGIGAITLLVVFSAAARSAKAVEILEDDEIAADADAGASGVASTSGDAGGRGTPTASAKPAAPKASDADLAAARAGGVEALSQLAQRFPEDAAVLHALFMAQAGDKKTYSAALRTARRLLDVSQAAGDDTAVRAALVNIANGPPDTAAVALDLMASEMGARGTDLLFEVASGSVMLSKTKAAALLRDADVRRHATPAVIIAGELLETRPCARKTLLARAKSDGDARALPFLRPLLNTVCGGGGGFRGLFGGGKQPAECYRCFTAADREEIQRAISAIEARNPDAAAPPAASGNLQ